MKFKYINNSLLLLIIIGIPNFFVVYDATHKSASSFIDINIILRLMIFTFLFLYIILHMFKWKKIQLYKLKAFYVPLGFYFLYLLLIPFFQNGMDLMKSSYRIVEYFIFFSFIMIYQDRHQLFTFKSLYQLLDWLFIYILCIVIIGLIFYPDKTIGLVDMGQTYTRLGGSVIHPNTLGNLSAIAILYYYYISKSKANLLLLFIFFIILVATYSRGAVFSLVVAFLLPYILLSKNKVIYIVLTGLFSMLFILFGIDFIVSYLSRGQGIEGFMTLSGRMTVWLSSIDIIFQNMKNLLIGISFGEASEMIANVMEANYHISYWKSHNAHNDFLQAWLGGGVVFFIITLYLYAKVYNYIKGIKNYRERFFLIGFLSIIFLFSVSMTTINYYLSTFSSLFWLLYLASINQKKLTKYYRINNV